MCVFLFQLKKLVCTEGDFKRGMVYITVEQEVKSRETAKTEVSFVFECAFIFPGFITFESDMCIR